MPRGGKRPGAGRKPAQPARPATEAPPLRLEWRSPAELAENPRNWRSHPETQIAALADVLAEVGWAGACLFNERTNRLIDGHARQKVALAQGTVKVPVLVGSWSEEQEAKILATLDPLAAMATADSAKLDALLREVQTTSQPLADMMTALAEQAKVIPNGNGEVGTNPVPDEEIETEDGDEDEDGLDLYFKAPYPWFGGKSRIARMVWRRFGDVKSYIEPFFGSGAVFLNRPLPFTGNETVNDFDGLICNFWRAVQADPDAVAKWADWPVNECDANARHAWLVGKKDALTAKLEGDPDYFDAKIAGWWCWGMACWIGRGYCSGNGPWQVIEAEDGTRQLVHLGNAGQGVNRQLVHLSDQGNGVNAVKCANPSEDGNPGLGERGLLEWMRAFSERLRRVRVCVGDWTRVCGGQSGDALQHFFVTGEPVGIFLDPPYKLNLDDGTANRGDVYNTDGAATDDVAATVGAWAIRHGDDPRLRIALCGYEGEYQMPPTWRCVAWKAHGGMAALSKGESAGKVNKYRERVWFSPHCLVPEKAEK